MSEQIANLPTVRVPEICEIVQLRADHPDYQKSLPNWNNGKPERLRVDGYFKSWKPPVREPAPADDVEAVMRNLLGKILDEGNREFEVAGKRTRLVGCLREEAEFVSCVGVCGHIYGINEVEVVGLVSWSEDVIAEERRGWSFHVGQVIF